MAHPLPPPFAQLKKGAASLDSPEAAKARLAELIALTPPDERFDAQSILAEHPEMRQYKSVVIDLAYEEYCRRRDAGEPVRASQFVQRFPGIQQSLLRVLEVDEYLQHDENLPLEMRDPVWPQAGDDYLGFRLINELGRGAFSRVFLAEERELGHREVVVKVCVHAGDEAAHLGRLSHANIVPINSVKADTEQALTAICMPWLGRATLLDVVDAAFRGEAPPTRADVIRSVTDGKLPVGAAKGNGTASRKPFFGETYAEGIVALGVQVCDGLSFSHARGIFHCDIKPSNILLTDAGTAMLLDFNLSRKHESGNNPLGGTLPYMAPEQLRWLTAETDDEPSSVQAQTDVFSLGVLMFEMLTGKNPFALQELHSFRTEAARETLERQRKRDYPVQELLRVAGGKLAACIESCLAFDPADRPASAAAVAEVLRDYLSLRNRCSRRIAKHKLAAGAMALVVSMALTAGAYYVGTRPPLYVREYRAGIVSLDAGDYRDAEERFSLAFEAEPNHPEALLARGWARLRAAEDESVNSNARKILIDQAKHDFSTLERLWESGQSAASLGQARAREGNDPGAARDEFQRAIDRGLFSAGVLNNLGYFLSKTDGSAAAIPRLKEAIEVNPHLPAPHWNLAFVEFRSAIIVDGQYRAALKRTETDNAQLYAQQLKTHLFAAVNSIRQAQELAPQSADVAFDALRIYLLAGRHADLLKEGVSEGKADEIDYRTAVRAACKSAIENGIDSKQLRSRLSEDDLNTLNDDPECREILNVSSPVQHPTQLSRLVDIYPDVRLRALKSP